MAVYHNSVTGCNTSDAVLPAYSSVMAGREIAASGFEDDICLEVSAKGSFTMLLPGVTAYDLYPLMAGKVIVSGLAMTRLPEFLDPGDCIMPDGNGGWRLSESGSVKVVTSAGSDGIGIVLLGSSNSAVHQVYEGEFSVRDCSSDDTFKIIVNGGETDLGTVKAKEFTVERTSKLYLLAEYIRDDGTSGHYKLTLTLDWEKDKVSDEYVRWLIADIHIETDKQNRNCLKIIQQHQNGEIFFGSRFWI